MSCGRWRAWRGEGLRGGGRGGRGVGGCRWRVLGGRLWCRMGWGRGRRE
uniref:Uncharacterized protein n=1 Tax=Arcella intermedia TaxID=1963864 RepID=A0A6B2LVV3_9EUKA